MATSSGGEKDGTATAKFNIPNQDSDDDSTHGDNEEIRQKIFSTLNDVFSKDLHIFHGVEDNLVQEVWVRKRPKIVFNYLFGNEIGNGSYGKVKEALHFKTNERKAIKIIKDKKVAKIPSGIANVQREYSILKQLDHPNIIRLIESFRVEEKSKLYLIFEFCVTSIGAMLDDDSKQRMNEYQAHFYFDQLIAGIDYLHSLGVIHKDIKPTNLLLTEENVLKIADFGVAEKCVSPNNDICTSSQGTPAFQAPEIVEGDLPSFHGKPIDIWACGITLFRMTTGDYPFKGDVLMKLFDTIIKEQFKLPEDISFSPELVELITGLLIKNPENRWTLKEIKACKWITMIHPIDEKGLIPLPDVDHSYFEEKLQQIEENMDDVDIVDNAVPFSGKFPPTVIDRTFQTPSFNRNIPYRTVNLVEDNCEAALPPTRLEFTTNSEGETTVNEVLSSSPLVMTSNNNTVPPAKLQPRRRRGFFSCFRPSNTSPE